MLGDRTGTVARPGLALVAALALMGCEDGLRLGAGGGAAGAEAAQAASSAGSGSLDVAAPDIFQVTESGLWDGRPSLGGVWVAHPDAVDPERVRIVNRTNGQEVIGALFRRERDLPGPALQVSSDAAEALGMLAGAPADLDVTALRRREEPETPRTEDVAPVAATAEPVAAETPVAPAAVPAATVPVATVDVDAVARATAAIVASAAVAPQASAAIATTALDAAGGQAASPLRSPFVQLGLFDQEANASEAAQALAAQGLPARVVPSSGGGGWRLLLGPATSAAEQEALLARAVAAGFEDAYLVRS